MTTLREAAQQAAEAIDQYLHCCFEKETDIQRDPFSKALYDGRAAIRAALAEPQTWVCPDAADTHRYDEPGHCEDCGKALIISTEIKGDKERAHGIGGDA